MEFEVQTKLGHPHRCQTERLERSADGKQLKVQMNLHECHAFQNNGVYFIKLVFPDVQFDNGRKGLIHMPTASPMKFTSLKQLLDKFSGKICQIQLDATNNQHMACGDANAMLQNATPSKSVHPTTVFDVHGIHFTGNYT
jgi:hypothetical protein